MVSYITVMPSGLTTSVASLGKKVLISIIIIKEIKEVEGYQTEEENEKEAEDHLWGSHYHIHCAGFLYVLLSEIFRFLI